MSRERKSGSGMLMKISVVLIVVTLIVTIVEGIYYRNRISQAAGEIEDTEKIEYTSHYTMIVEDKRSNFWQNAYYGAVEAGKEQKAYVELFGSSLGTDDSKEELMRIAIAAKVDGIILEANETESMGELINQAEENNIPVVTILSDNTECKRQSFIGVSNYELGETYGKEVYKVLQENGYQEQQPRNVLVLMNGDSDHYGQKTLYFQLCETLKKHSGITISSEEISMSNTFLVEEAVRDIFMQSELPDVVVCLDELTTECVYQAVVDYNKVDCVNIIGYYDGDTILKAIENNIIYSSVSIDAELMGKYCVDALEEYRKNGKVNKYFTTDISIIHNGNVQEYAGGKNEAEE